MPELWSQAEHRRLTRLCALITGDPTTAEDLAQETLLQAWRVRDRLVDPTGGRAWLDAVARHVCRRWQAAHGRRRARETVSGTLPEAGYDELAEVLERQELAELLDRALALLPPETRAALVARYVEELGPAQIAQRLALSPEAVSMRLTRGRSAVRRVLETDLADEPLAQLWLERYGAAWRPTRLHCPTCGRPTTSMRRDRTGRVVELRCEACEPTSVASRWRLDNPAHGPRLASLQRPSAMAAHMAGWMHAWWPAAIEAGHAACTRCSVDVSVRPYERPGLPDPYVGRGWHAACGSCGEELSSSLLGLLLVSPEARRLRAERPRAHVVPTRAERADGRPLLVVGLHDDASGDRVELLVDDATTRPLGVVVSR